MYSSEDFERFYFQYQTDSLPHGESIQSFCNRNKVPYNVFYKWYRDTRKKVVEVTVDGRPQEQVSKVQVLDSSPAQETAESVRIWVDLRLSNGLRITKKNLSYQSLVQLIEKLEGLC